MVVSCSACPTLPGVAAALGAERIPTRKHGDLRNVIFLYFLPTELDMSLRQNPGRLEGNSITDILETIYSPFGAQKFWRLRWHRGRPSLLHSGVLTANILEGDCRLSLGTN